MRGWIIGCGTALVLVLAAGPAQAGCETYSPKHQAKCYKFMALQSERAEELLTRQNELLEERNRIAQRALAQRRSEAAQRSNDAAIRDILIFQQSLDPGVPLLRSRPSMQQRMLAVQPNMVLHTQPQPTVKFHAPTGVPHPW